jgi:predicted CopG family antitoxin
MSTTIQVSDTTKQLLQKIKEEIKASSFDEIINGLLQKKQQIPNSMFEVDKGMKWTKADRLNFREL